MGIYRHAPGNTLATAPALFCGLFADDRGSWQQNYGKIALSFDE
jgi:hypothetical protein